MWSTDLVLFENDAAAAYAFSAARSALQLIVRLVYVVHVEYVVYAIQPDGRRGESVHALTLRARRSSRVVSVVGASRATIDRGGPAGVALCMPRGIPTRPA